MSAAITRMGYRECLDWLLNNDDTTFLDDRYGSPSVTVCLVADIFRKKQDTVVADMRKRRAKLAPWAKG